MAWTYWTSPVCLVSLVQPNKPDRPNRPHEQDRLADFFSILLEDHDQLQQEAAWNWQLKVETSR